MTGPADQALDRARRRERLTQPVRHAERQYREHLVEPFANAGRGTRVPILKPPRQILQQAPSRRDLIRPCSAGLTGYGPRGKSVAVPRLTAPGRSGSRTLEPSSMPLDYSRHQLRTRHHLGKRCSRTAPRWRLGTPRSYVKLPRAADWLRSFMAPMPRVSVLILGACRTRQHKTVRTLTITGRRT